MTSGDREARPEAAPSNPETDRYRVEALAKGLRVLHSFTEQMPEGRLFDIAAATGLSASTAYRMLVTLESEGYVERTDDDRYRPGAAVLRLGFSALRSLDVVTLARPLLRRLAETTNETVNLGKLAGDQVLYLIRIRNRDLVTATVDVGSLLPAPSTSMGKLLLAAVPDDELDAAVSPAALAAGRGPNAIRDLGELRRHLDMVRGCGWALQDEEVEYGLRSLAVPVLGQDTTVAAINLAVQASQWSVEDLVAAMLPPAVRAATELSQLLGFEGQYPVSVASDGPQFIPFRAEGAH